MKTDIVSGRDAFASLESVWRGLEESGQATIFQTWDWCDCRLKHYGAGIKPLVALTTSDDELAAITPLAVGRSWLGTPVRRISFIATGPSDYGGFVTKVEPAKIAAELPGALAGKTFDLLDLHQIPESTATALSEAAGERYNVKVLEQESSFPVELPDDFDTYLSTLSKKFRTNTVYADRRLRRDGRYEERAFQGPGDIAAGMDIFYKLHQQRWLAKRLPGLFLAGRNRRFHLDVAERLAKSDRLLLRVAFVDREPAAALYGYKYAGVYSYYLGGFDPSVSKYSVSSVLIFNLIKEAIDSRASTFDFLRGDEPYKPRWGAERTPLFRVIAWPSTARGRLAADLAQRHNALVQKARAKLHS